MKKLYLLFLYSFFQFQSYCQEDTLSTLPHWLLTDSTYNFSSTTDSTYQKIQLYIISRDKIKFTITMSNPNKWPYLQNQSITGIASYFTTTWINEMKNENIISWEYQTLNNTLSILLEFDPECPLNLGIQLYQLQFSNQEMK